MPARRQAQRDAQRTAGPAGGDVRARRDLRTAAILAFLALLVRLWRLGDEPIWVDEAYSLHAARQGWWAIATLPEQTPPLYNLLLKAWTLVAGDSATALRLPSALFGALAVGAVYLAARRSLPPRAAQAAALLVLLNFYLVRYSQTARTYALFVLLAALSYWLAPRDRDARQPPAHEARPRGDAAGLRAGPAERQHTDAREATRRRRSRLRTAAYVGVTSLMLYSHVYGLFVLGAQALTAVLRARDAPAVCRRWLALLGAALLPFLLWAPILLSRAAAVQEHFWIMPPDRHAVALLVTSVAGMGLGGFWDRVATLAFMLLALLGAAHLWHQRAQPDRRAHLATLVPWLLVPTLVPLALSLAGRPFFTPTYTMAAWPAAAILAAHGAYAKRWAIGRRAALAVVLVLLAASSVHAVTSPQNQDWRGAVRAIDAAATPGDLVVSSLGYCGGPGLALEESSMQCPWDVYSGRRDLRFAAFLPGYVEVGPEHAPALDALLRNETARTVWVVHADGGDPHGLIAARLDADHDLAQALELRRIRVERWDPSAA